MTEKKASELHAYFAQLRDVQPLEVSCLFCGWSLAGSAGVARERALEHRRAKHPEACVRRPKKRGLMKKRTLRSASEEAQARVDAAEANRVRAEREDAERLAKVLRGRLRDGVAA